jgi:hypothetical protein
MSSIAVFLVLGGAAAFAATQLPKNSVGSKQLKKNAVTTAKIKKGAVTGAKVNVSGFPKVPTAASADNATNATNASHAANADTIGGLGVKKFFYTSNTSSAVTQVVSLGGLTLNASCPAGNLEAFATTSVGESEIHAGGSILFEEESFYNENDFFSTSSKFFFLAESEADSNEGTLTYATPGGSVVTVVFLSEEDSLNHNCVLAGTATGS